jgi:tetratricopeptide (TPR) repeat protein
MLRRAREIALAIIFSACASAQEQALREAARLDAEGKCEQAERYYRQALSKGAPSATFLNHAGNHYLLCGQTEKARFHYEAFLRINPAHQNANR